MLAKYLSLVFVCLCLNFLQAQEALKTKYKKPKPYDYTQDFKSLETIKNETSKINRIAWTMHGHYSNRRQADTVQHPYYQSQEIVYLPIWQEKRLGEHWTYVVWFAEGRPEQPLGDFVFKLEKFNRDTFLATMYLLPDKLVPNWQETQAFDNLNPQDLHSPQGCTARLVEVQTGRVQWLANDFCHQVLSDQIHYHRIHMQFYHQGIKEFTSYYNTNKEVVFALPPELPCHFERLDPKKKKKKK